MDLYPPSDVYMGIFGSRPRFTEAEGSSTARTNGDVAGLACQDAATQFALRLTEPLPVHALLETAPPFKTLTDGSGGMKFV